MIIATRTLKLHRDSHDQAIQVAIHAPVEGDRSWDCRFEIGWPEGTISRVASGHDGVQALFIAMQRIAVELYGSDHHRTSRLRWDKPGSGYGFPMPKVGRDELIGEDRLAQG